MGMLGNGRDEPVTTPRHGFDKPGIFRGIPESIPHLADGTVDRVVEVDEGVAVPELIVDLFPRDYVAGALDQEAENLKWLLLNLDANAALPQFAGPEVQFEDAEMENRI